jgi:hypothetical protein
MKNAVFWDVMPYASSKNRRLGGTYNLHHQDENNCFISHKVNVSSQRASVAD